MARPKMEDGRTETVSFKVSKAKFAQLEAARGMLSRSSVLEEALDLWLERQVYANPRRGGGGRGWVPFSSAGRQ